MTDWRGAEALRPFLRRIDGLTPMKDNPRRGNIPEIAKSLLTFGQMLPVLVDEDDMIIAGNHVTLAAQRIGWTHIAVLAHEFADGESARAFMLADNRTHDLGAYEQAMLVEHLAALVDLDRLVGTGYGLADVDELHSAIAKQEEQREQHVFHAGTAAPPVEMEELVLLYTPDQREQLKLWERMVSKERGTKSLSDTYYAAMGIAANVVNG